MIYFRKDNNYEKRYNLIRRTYWVNGQREKANALPCEVEKPLGYIVLFGESGVVVGSFVVDGKVSSLNSFLTPDSEYYEQISSSDNSSWYVSNNERLQVQKQTKTIPLKLQTDYRIINQHQQILIIHSKVLTIVIALILVVSLTACGATMACRC